MKSEWKEYTVQELIDLEMLDEPLDGNHGSIHPKASDYVNEGVPFIMANNLINGVVDLDGCAFISEEQAKTLRKGFAKPGDVLLTHKATIGRTAIVPDRYETIILTPQVTYYRVKQRIDNRYLKYYFDSPDFQTTLNNWAGSGSTRAYLGITAQHKLPVILPPYCEQRKIADILEVLDRKIQLNTEINNNLEQQARAIYQQVFIENRKPNWKEGNLSDLVSVKYGKDHKKLDDGCYPVYGSGGIMRYVEKPLYTGESVLIPRKGTLNNVLYVNGAFWSVDTMFYTEMLRPNIAKFVYQFMKGKDLASLNAGSAVPSMTTNILNAMQLYIPDDETLCIFEETVAPMYSQMQENEKQSANLAIIRDTLLPRLMSGELDVSDIEL